MYKHILLSTNVIMKKGSFDDWEDLYQNIWSRKESARYMLWDIITSPCEAQNRMRHMIDWQKDHLFYIIYEASNQKAIGFAGMKEVQPHVYEDTGIAIGPDFVGKGYGKQILNALIEYCSKDLHAKRIIYSCRSENIPSKMLQQSCGFHYTHSEKRIDRKNNQQYILDFYEFIVKTN